jgi:hypothetical protein
VLIASTSVSISTTNNKQNERCIFYAPLCFFEDRDAASELATHFSSKKLLSLYDASLSAIDDLERNANIRLVLLNMMQSANLI